MQSETNYVSSVSERAVVDYHTEMVDEYSKLVETNQINIVLRIIPKQTLT